MRSDLIDLAGIIRHETDAAILFDDGSDGKTWLPKSLVEVDHHAGTITLPEWLVEEKGLI